MQTIAHFVVIDHIITEYRMDANRITPGASTGRAWRCNPMAKTLIKNGTIISMDRRVGDFQKGDILVNGDKIEKIAKSLCRIGECLTPRVAAWFA